MVMKKQISIQSFFEKYPDDESCYRYLAEEKWKDGFHCQNAVATNTARGIRFMPEGVKAVDMMNR